MSVPKVTSVAVDSYGAHDHVRVFVDGMLAGELVLSEGDGRWLANVIRVGSMEVDEQVRTAAAGIDPPWLVKDFNALYRAAIDAALSVPNTPPWVALNAQLDRLRSAFELTEKVREAGRKTKLEPLIADIRWAQGIGLCPGCGASTSPMGKRREAFVDAHCTRCGYEKTLTVAALDAIVEEPSHG